MGMEQKIQDEKDMPLVRAVQTGNGIDTQVLRKDRLLRRGFCRMDTGEINTTAADFRLSAFHFLFHWS